MGRGRHRAPRHVGGGAPPLAYSSPHFCEMVFTETVLRVRGLALPHKYALESDASIGEGRAAVLVVPARARVPDVVKIGSAFKTPGRATQEEERLERFLKGAVSTIIEEGFGPVLAERREALLRKVGFESRRPFKSG